LLQYYVGCTDQKQQKGNKNVPFKLSKLQKLLSDKDKHVGKEQAVKGDKSGNLETEKDNHSGKEQAAHFYSLFVAFDHSSTLPVHFEFSKI
jgi:hypothetical protein